MKTDLRSKLKSCLELDPLEEKDAVYILVEIGKIIELTKTQEKYRALYFYRNWAVHAIIDKQTPFVKELKERFKLTDALSERVFGFVTFIEVENEIIRFFHQQVESNLLPPRTFLNAFRKALIQVIADVPVHMKSDEIDIIISFDKSGELIIQGPGEYQGTIRVLR